MAYRCNQCGEDCGGRVELSAHLLNKHGLNMNPPPPRSLGNLYEIVEKLSQAVEDLAAQTEADIADLDSRLSELEEPDE